MRLAPFALSLALLLPAVPVAAASMERVDALLVELKVEQQFAQVRQIMTDGFEQSLQQVAAREKLSPEQVAKVRERLAPMREGMIEMMSWNGMKDEIREIYAQELTDEEVDAALVYYRSPQGRSMIAKMPVLMQRGAEVGQRRAAAVMPKLMEDIQRAVGEAD